MAEVYAADIYTAEMHARPSNQQCSRSCSDAEIAAEVAPLIQPVAIVLPNAVFIMLRDTLSLFLLGCSTILQCHEVQRLSLSPLHHSSVL